MQKIEQLLQSQSFPQTLLSLAYWLYFTIRHHSTISPNPLLHILLCFNILTLLECHHSSLNTIIISCLLCLISSKNGEVWMWEKIVGVVLIGVVEPIYVPVCVLWAGLEGGEEGKFRKWMQGIILMAIGLLSIYYLNYNHYFAQQFPITINPTWLLYSHLFHSYLHLYQTLLTLSPFLLTFPLLFLHIPPSLKIATLYFLTTFVHPTPSAIHLWALYFLQSLCYGEIIGEADRRQRVVWRVLTVMMVVVSGMTLGIYWRVVGLWQTTHFVSVGFFVVQGLVFWGVHAVYLSEGLIALEKEKQKEEKDRLGVLGKIGQYFKQRLKEM